MLRFLVLSLMLFMGSVDVAQAAMTEYPKVRLRSLDKITARTMTFDAAVGTTIKFGSIYIKILSCQKPDVQERDDAAAFLQVWEITTDDVSKWIFSGWMYAASPAVSAMDHPIYDVWVMDCLDDGTVAKAKAEVEAKKKAEEEAKNPPTPAVTVPAAPLAEAPVTQPAAEVPAVAPDKQPIDNVVDKATSPEGVQLVPQDTPTESVPPSVPVE